MAIQMEKAMALANSTTQEFKDNCQHQFEKEYALGAATGDLACVICGETKIRR